MYELYSKNDKVINKINPWENAMRYISLGLIFTFFNFNFSILSYIMMYLGAMFLCLGLYKLKEENINFKIACNIAFVKIFLVTFNLLYYASRYNFNDKKVIIIKVIISMLFNSIILINICKGIEKTFKKCNLKENKIKMDWCIILYLINIILMFTEIYIPQIIFLPLIFEIIFYILIIKTIIKAGKVINGCDYKISENKIKISLENIAKIYSVIIIVAILGCLYVSYNPKVISYEKEEIKNEKVISIKNEMIEKGFDSDIINCFTEEEILKYKDIKSVNIGNELIREVDGGSLLLKTGVANLGKIYRIFVYYQWIDMPKHKNVDLLEISIPASKGLLVPITSSIYTTNNTSSKSKINYEILSKNTYEKEGKIYNSSSIKEKFDSESDLYKDLAEIRLDNKGNNQKGFIADSYLKASEYEINVPINFNYYHQNTILKYPYKNAMEYNKDSYYNFTNKKTSFNLIQNYNNFNL